MRIQLRAESNPAPPPDAKTPFSAPLGLRHRLVSENSSFSTKVSRTVDLSGPTGSGLRLKKDLAADRAAKPEVLGIDILYGFFALKANGHNYVLINIKGPTGYKWIGFYPQPAG